WHEASTRVGTPSDKEPPAAGDVAPPLPPLPETTEASDTQNLVPALPPIDPSIVEALQKVLLDAGDPGVPHLIVHVEEQRGREEQENAIPPEWPSEPSEVEFPSLFIDPVDDPLTIAEEEESLERVVSPAVDWSKLIQEVIDAIRAAKSVLVGNAGAELERESELQLGSAKIEILTGLSGQRFILVSLSLEASGDLRALQ